MLLIHLMFKGYYISVGCNIVSQYMLTTKSKNIKNWICRTKKLFWSKLSKNSIYNFTYSRHEYKEPIEITFASI